MVPYSMELVLLNRKRLFLSQAMESLMIKLVAGLVYTTAIFEMVSLQRVLLVAISFTLKVSCDE